MVYIPCILILSSRGVGLSKCGFIGSSYHSTRKETKRLVVSSQFRICTVECHLWAHYFTFAKGFLSYKYVRRLDY